MAKKPSTNRAELFKAMPDRITEVRKSAARRERDKKRKEFFDAIVKRDQ